MNHLTLRGTHREMGFQWGARLAERGLRLLDHVPFPLEAERRAFAAACHPAYARHFPAALEELEGAGGGAELPAGGLGDGPLHHLRPAARLRLFLPGGVQQERGVLRTEQRLSDGAGAGLHPCDIRIFRQGDPLYREHHLVRADGGRRQRPGGWPSGSPLSTRPGPGRV